MDKEKKLLATRIDELEMILAETYQVVGSLAESLGVFNELPVIKALDNLSAQAMVHKDVLPFGLVRVDPRLVSFSDDMSTCTLNKGGEEYYYDLVSKTS